MTRYVAHHNVEYIAYGLRSGSYHSAWGNLYQCWKTDDV